jgi:predicted Zn-dependent protease
LSVIDPDFDQKTIETIDTAISKAPTDPKLYYNKALILSQQQKLPEAIETINQAITLKPNYREAKISLAELYIKNKQPEQAVETITQVLKAIPNDPDALKVLQEATESAQ